MKGRAKEKRKKVMETVPLFLFRCSDGARTLCRRTGNEADEIDGDEVIILF